MDEETKAEFAALRNVIDENSKAVLAVFTKTHNETLELKKQVGGLETQVGINCTKLDSMDKKLDSIVEIVTANGQGIEVLSGRIDKLEK